MMCSVMSIQLMTEYSESNIHFQASDDSAMGMTKGMRITPCTRRLPLNERFKREGQGQPDHQPDGLGAEREDERVADGLPERRVRKDRWKFVKPV